MLITRDWAADGWVARVARDHDERHEGGTAYLQDDESRYWSSKRVCCNCGAFQDRKTCDLKTKSAAGLLLRRVFMLARDVHFLDADLAT